MTTETPTATLRASLSVRYPQIIKLASNILDLITENDPATTETVNSITDNFINDAKIYHNIDIWLDNYNRGVILLACHFIIEAAPKAPNTGVVITDKRKDSVETTYLKPNTKANSEFSTTKYGRQWEALRDSVIVSPGVYVI